MATSFDDIFGVNPFRITVPVGATNAYFLNVIHREKALMIKYVSGGTLEILPASQGGSLINGGSQLYSTPNFLGGSTQTPGMLAALSGTGYVMTAGEVISIDGPCRMYLSSTGATTIIHAIQGTGQGS